MSQSDNSPKGRLLIIDDNRSIHDDFHKILTLSDENAELISAELAFFGAPSVVTPQVVYDINHAYQGQEGLDLVVQGLVRNRPYDVAFVDMRMPPGWDGVETVERLWEKDPELQIVICTAYSDYTWSEIIERLGCNDNLLILKKPFDNVEVAQFAFALTEKRRLSRQANLKMEELEALVQIRTQKLQESRAESERLLDAISSVLIGIDCKGLVERWNFSAEEIFGISAKEVIGRSFVELDIKWVNRDKILEILAVKDATQSKSYEIEYYDQHHSTRLLGLSVYPIKEVEQFCGVLILGKDLTEQRLLEIKLQQTHKLESIGQLAAGVAHEINTPIQFVSNNLDFLRQGFDCLLNILHVYEDLSDPILVDSYCDSIWKDIVACKEKNRLGFVRNESPRAFIEVIDGIKQVSEIVKAMKSFSHPGSQKKTPADLNQAILEALVVARHEWRHIAEIEADLASDLPLVPCLLGEFKQVMLNLLLNAAHAIDDVVSESKDKGVISVKTYLDGDHVKIEVCDTGGGIPESIHHRIFDPFFTTKDVGRGSGQGLAIAHNIIVHKHGGELTFETQNNQGTKFYIDLPMYEI